MSLQFHLAVPFNQNNLQHLVAGVAVPCQSAPRKCSGNYASTFLSINPLPDIGPHWDLNLQSLSRQVTTRWDTAT